MITNDRTLIWSATENVYNKSITLSEPLTHFEEYEIYASGMENATAGVHVAKTSFNTTENKVNGCDSWGYSPWTTTYNYILGSNIKISGSSGFVGSSYYMGQGSNTTAYAAGKWVNADAPKMLQPFKIFGLDRKPTYKLKILNTVGGTLSADITNGYEYDTTTLTNATANEDYKFSSYNITGATLTGNEFMWNDNDVQVQGNFEHNKTLTLIDGEHAVLSADKDKGFIGDVVTVTGTMDEGWYLTGFNTTGATMTGNKFAFIGEDVTVEGLYTDEGFPVVYEAENGVHLTGDTQIAIPGVGISLTTSYDTYYRTNGYDITGGYIENGMLYATAACTARLKSKLNAFTATGGFEKGSNITCYANSSPDGTRTTAVGAKYCTHGAHTGEIPTSWYSTSNRWKPNNVSGYSFTMTAKMYFTGSVSHNLASYGYTAWCMVGSTTSNSQSWTKTSPATYSKTLTTTTQNVNYGVNATLGATRSRSHAANSTYVATGTNGTWRATGYAP